MATLTKKTFPLGDLGDVRFAALGFDQLDELKEELDLIMAPGGADFRNPAARAAVVKLATASLQRDKPGTTEAQVKRELDTFNFPLVVNAIFDRNGFLDDGSEPKTEGEAGAAASPT